MIRLAALACLLSMLMPVAPGTASATEVAPTTTLELANGVDETGRASPQWLAMIRKRLPEDRYAAIAPLRKPLTTQERAWAALVGSRIRDWQRIVPELALDYRPVAPPPKVRIVIGNRGAEDAFTHDPVTIGFDLAALQANYGDAQLPENAARMDRFFRHEFVHLMQKAWLSVHPASLDTPLQRALSEMWTEGLGNRESLSARWADVGGKRSEAASRALAELEPRLAARLSALACVTPADAPPLTADLSNGRFDRKWGALPVALWLQQERTTRPDASRELVVAGPAGLWAMADRHLPDQLRAVLTEARAAEALCRNAGMASRKD